jgi:hypothetical protein
MTEKKASVTARWRKQPDEKGRARSFQTQRGLQLREGTKVVINVAPYSDSRGRSVDGWYWYGMGRNTCKEPCATIEEAKAQADAFYKESKKITGTTSEGEGS